MDGAKWIDEGEEREDSLLPSLAKFVLQLILSRFEIY